MLEDPPAVQVQLVMRSGSNTVIRPWTGDLSPAMLRPDWAMIVQIRKGQVIWQVCLILNDTHMALPAG